MYDEAIQQVIISRKRDVALILLDCFAAIAMAPRFFHFLLPTKKRYVYLGSFPLYGAKTQKIVVVFEIKVQYRFNLRVESLHQAAEVFPQYDRNHDRDDKFSQPRLSLLLLNPRQSNSLMLANQLQ